MKFKFQVFFFAAIQLVVLIILGWGIVAVAGADELSTDLPPDLAQLDRTFLNEINQEKIPRPADDLQCDYSSWSAGVKEIRSLDHAYATAVNVRNSENSICQGYREKIESEKKPSTETQNQVRCCRLGARYATRELLRLAQEKKSGHHCRADIDRGAKIGYESCQKSNACRVDTKSHYTVGCYSAGYFQGCAKAINANLNQTFGQNPDQIYDSGHSKAIPASNKEPTSSPRSVPGA